MVEKTSPQGASPRASMVSIPTTTMESSLNVYLVFQFVLLGILTRLGFNCLVTVFGNEKDYIGKHWGFFLPFVNNLGVSIGQVFIILYGEKFGFTSRIWFSCLSMCALLGTMGIFFAALYPDPESWVFGLCLALLTLFSIASGVFQSTLVGMAALGPRILMTSVFIGLGLSGLVGWPVSKLIEFIRHSSNVTSGTDQASSIEIVSIVSFGAVATSLGTLLYHFKTKQDPLVQMMRSLVSLRHGDLGDSEIPQRSVMQIVRSTLPLALTGWYSNIITYFIYPGVVAEFGFSSEEILGLVFFIGQVGDVMGQCTSLPAFKNFFSLSPLAVKVGALLRTVFVVYFIFVLKSQEGQFLHSDWVRGISCFVFNLTHSIIQNWVMGLGPSQVDVSEREVSGYTMVFFNINGALCGSLVYLAAKRALGIEFD